MARNFYVVFIGHQPGIYTSWPECQRQILGFSNNSVLGFYTLEDAVAAFKNYFGVSTEPVLFQPGFPPQLVSNQAPAPGGPHFNLVPDYHPSQYSPSATPITLEKQPSTSVSTECNVIHCQYCAAFALGFMFACVSMKNI